MLLEVGSLICKCFKNPCSVHSEWSSLLSTVMNPDIQTCQIAASASVEQLCPGSQSIEGAALLSPLSAHGERVPQFSSVNQQSPQRPVSNSHLQLPRPLSGESSNMKTYRYLERHRVSKTKIPRLKLSVYLWQAGLRNKGCYTDKILLKQLEPSDGWSRTFHNFHVFTREVIPLNRTLLSRNRSILEHY